MKTVGIYLERSISVMIQKEETQQNLLQWIQLNMKDC